MLENTKKYFKNLFLNEYLEKPFIERKNSDKKNLSTTRDPIDVMDSLAFASEDSFLSMNTVSGWSDYIGIWRRLFAYNIEVEEAVTEIVNEAIVAEAADSTIKLDWRNTEKIDKKKLKTIQDEWLYIYDLLDMEENASTYFQRWYIDAVLVGELVYSNKNRKEGVKYIDILEPKNLVLDYDTKTQKELLRRITDGSANYNIVKRSDKVWLEEQFAYADSGLFDPDLKIYLSYLNYAVRPTNQLNSIENALIVYALTRSTEKLVYYIDVGDLPYNKALAKIQDVARKYSSALKYDSDSGNILGVKDKIKLSKEIFLGTRGGERGTTVETISADQINLGELPILEYFQDKVYRSLKVPRLRRREEAMFNFGDNGEIERQEINFYKFIVKLRAKFNRFFKEILKKHLLAKEIITEEEWVDTINREIRFVYANNNNYEEIKRIAQLKSKLELMNDIKEYAIKNEQGEIILFSSEYIKKNIMKFTDDEIKELDKQIEVDVKAAKPLSDEPTDENPDNNFNKGFEDFADEDKDELFEEINDGDLAVDIDLEDYEKLIGALKEGDELIPVGKDGKPLGVEFKLEKGKLVKK